MLVGINLLREGLDLPEVSLVAILDADKEGFLRSARSLIQTIGRAARNVNGTVILYADVITDSMRRAIDETNRRRTVQEALQPRARHHAADDQEGDPANPLVEIGEADYVTIPVAAEGEEEYRTAEDLSRAVARLRREMRDAAKDLEFERAAELRDRLQHLEAREIELRTGVRVS